MPTINTVVSVATSTATHINPMLLASKAKFMANIIDLVNRVIEAHMGGGEFASLDFVLDIARAVGARREADEGREHDENDVQVVDEEIVARLRAME